MTTNEWNKCDKKNPFALRVLETVERESFFESISGIDTLKNIVDKFK